MDSNRRSKNREILKPIRRKTPRDTQTQFEIMRADGCNCQDSHVLAPMA
jgi:hypothetical protein